MIAIANFCLITYDVRPGNDVDHILNTSVYLLRELKRQSPIIKTDKERKKTRHLDI